MSAVTESSALKALRDYMRGQRSGDVVVLDTHAEHLLDEYMEDYIYFTLILDDPAPGLEVWPVLDVRALHRRAYKEARRLEITPRVSVHAGSLGVYGQFVGGDR
jgi:hypothetical protein